MRHPHVTDLLPASKHRTDGEHGAENIAVLSAKGAVVPPPRPQDPARPLLPPQPVRPSPAVVFRAPADERLDRPRASEGPIQRRGDGSAGGPGDRASVPGCSF